jgi:hypothetical protein
LPSVKFPSIVGTPKHQFKWLEKKERIYWGWGWINEMSLEYFISYWIRYSLIMGKYGKGLGVLFLK